MISNTSTIIYNYIWDNNNKLNNNTDNQFTDYVQQILLK